MAQNKMTVYHGTSGKAAESIRREQHFHESKKDNEWLGHGVYFFAYPLHAALWIARRKLEEGTVLTVQLCFEDKELLDLDDPEQLDALNREMSRLNQRIGDKIALPPADKDTLWKRWCLGCNLYRKLHPEIGIISYTFPQRKVGAACFHNNERQLCVSRHEMISDIT